MLDEARLQQEVERRILLLKDNEEALMRYDLNGNGIIDEWEWEEIRRVISVQVQTQWRRNVLDWQTPTDPSSKSVTSTRWAPSTQTLRDRYDIITELGEGAQGFAFIGRDIVSGKAVVIKKLPLELIAPQQLAAFFSDEWPRLAALDHPGTASYIDAFEQGEYFVLVQEQVDGESLDAMLRRGVHFTEEDVIYLLMDLLDVLIELHEHSPPILHHDIKPSNIVQRPDGRYVLVDFGALPAARGEHVVGTSGYTPVEELMGQPVPASDLYGVGATAIHLLSRIHPGDMPIEFMQIVYRPFIDVSDDFADFLGKLVEAHVEHRFASARKALSALDGCLDGLLETRRRFIALLNARSRATALVRSRPAAAESTSLVSAPAGPLTVTETDPGPPLTQLLVVTILAFAIGYLLAVWPF
jgi:serine/threonine protein kinase